MAIHSVYNIQPDARLGTRGQRGVHHWSGRSGGKVGRREVAIPRAVSCSHIQPRASFCRAFLPTFANLVILTSGTARCIGVALRKKKQKTKKWQKSRGRSAAAGEHEISRKESRPGVKGLPARRKGERGVENHWTFRQRCLIFRK